MTDYDFDSPAEAAADTIVGGGLVDYDSEAEAFEDSTGTRSRPATPNTRGIARKAIAKYIEVSAAPPKQLALLAATVGGKADAAELAATIVSSPRPGLGALNDIAALAGDDIYDSLLAAAGLGRERSRRAWALLTHLGQVSGNLPAKEMVAATDLAKAVARLTPDDHADLDAVRRLGSK